MGNWINELNELFWFSCFFGPCLFYPEFFDFVGPKPQKVTKLPTKRQAPAQCAPRRPPPLPSVKIKLVKRAGPVEEGRRFPGHPREKTPAVSSKISRTRSVATQTASPDPLTRIIPRNLMKFVSSGLYYENMVGGILAQGSNSFHLMDWFIYCSIDRLIDWLIDWFSANRLIDSRLIDWLIDWLGGWCGSGLFHSPHSTRRLHNYGSVHKMPWPSRGSCRRWTAAALGNTRPTRCRWWCCSAVPSARRKGSCSRSRWWHLCCPCCWSSSTSITSVSLWAATSGTPPSADGLQQRRNRRQTSQNILIFRLFSLEYLSFVLWEFSFVDFMVSPAVIVGTF